MKGEKEKITESVTINLRKKKMIGNIRQDNWKAHDRTAKINPNTSVS